MTEIRTTCDKGHAVTAWIGEPYGVGVPFLSLIEGHYAPAPHDYDRYEYTLGGCCWRAAVECLHGDRPAVDGHCVDPNEPTNSTGPGGRVGGDHD